jgi:hypothetical protein
LEATPIDSKLCEEAGEGEGEKREKRWMHE